MAQTNRALEKLAEWMALIGGLVVFVLMIMVTVDALGRKLWTALPGALEFSETLMVPAVFLPLMFIQMKREHVFVGAVTGGLSLRTQSLLDAISAVIGVVLFALLTWLAIDKAVSATQIQEYRIALISVPIWPFRWFVVLGTGLMVVQLVFTAIEEFRRAFGDEEPTSGHAGGAAHH